MIIMVYIKLTVFLLPSKNGIHKGHGNSGLLKRGHLSFRVLALNVRFKMT